MTYRSSCNQTTLETAYDGFAHFGKDRRELVSVTVETWKDRRAYTEDVQPKAAEYRLCDGVLLPVIEVRPFPCGCCQYQAPATECVAICTYQAIFYNYENTPSVINWVVVGGTIVSGQGTDTIEVQTVAGVNVALDITVTATDPSSGDTAGATGIVEHCHEDTTVCPIFIGPPFQDLSYADGYTLGSFTTADRFFGYITTYSLVGNWPSGMSIDVNTGVISGTMDGVGTYTGLQVSAYGDGRCPIAYSNVFEVEITDATEEGVEITETVGGACTWDIGTGGCTATGTYVATPSGFATPPDTWVWEVTTANATIISGQGSDTVQVSTTGGTDVTFTLKVTASNASGEEASKFEQYTHTHTDAVEETLLVSEVASGSCDYQSPSVLCAANGTYTASPGGFNIAPDNWVWEVVTGAAIITSGQGTQTVVVTSDAASDVTFNLKATATNLFTGETANDTQTFTHTHTQLSSTLLALPLLEDRYETGGGTNHALLDRDSTASVKEYDGTISLVKVQEFRFENTDRTDLSDATDYGAGVLGVDYTEIADASHGLMVYDTSQNYIRNSEDFSTWNYDAGVPIGSGAPTLISHDNLAPDGTNTAALLDFYQTDTTSQMQEQCPDVDIADYGAYTFSVWLKASPTNSVPYIAISINNGGWSQGGSDYAFVTSEWTRFETTQTLTTYPQAVIGNVVDGVLNDTIVGGVLMWGAQVNLGASRLGYVQTNGNSLDTDPDDVHCLWPTGVVNDFTLSVEWVPSDDIPSTILESGNFRIFYTGSQVNVTNGDGTASFVMTVVPFTLYFIQAEFSSTSGIIMKLNTVNGTSSPSTVDIVPAVDGNLQIGARANLTEFINGTIKNINMTTEPLPSGNTTFDSSTVTFDSTAYTMDMT